MRSNIDNALVRGNIQTSAMLYLGEILAITANLAIASGGPMIIALDPANTGRNVSLYTPTTHPSGTGTRSSISRRVRGC
jgi:hypothetical protein